MTLLYNNTTISTRCIGLHKKKELLIFSGKSICLDGPLYLSWHRFNQGLNNLFRNATSTTKSTTLLEAGFLLLIAFFRTMHMQVLYRVQVRTLCWPIESCYPILLLPLLFSNMHDDTYQGI